MKVIIVKGLEEAHGFLQLKMMQLYQKKIKKKLYFLNSMKKINRLKNKLKDAKL